MSSETAECVVGNPFHLPFLNLCQFPLRRKRVNPLSLCTGCEEWSRSVLQLAEVSPGAGLIDGRRDLPCFGEEEAKTW